MNKKMKKTVLVILLFFAVMGLWGQNSKFNIVNYTIGTLNVMSEYNNATIVLRSKQVVKTNLYEEQYKATVYELEILLNNKNNSIEKILLTEGGYGGGYAIYFDNVVFLRHQEKKFRCEYYEDHEENLITLYFYDTDSKSRDPYVMN
jgi:hypothetical protein